MVNVSPAGFGPEAIRKRNPSLEEFLEEPDVAEIFRYVIRSFHCSTKHLPH